MRWIFMFAFLASLFGCTSLNNKCDYLPPGDCWTDVYSCACGSPHANCTQSPSYAGSGVAKVGAG